MEWSLAQLSRSRNTVRRLLRRPAGQYSNIVILDRLFQLLLLKATLK